jgi:hypothetical protein
MRPSEDRRNFVLERPCTDAIRVSLDARTPGRRDLQFELTILAAAAAAGGLCGPDAYSLHLLVRLEEAQERYRGRWARRSLEDLVVNVLEEIADIVTFSVLALEVGDRPEARVRSVTDFCFACAGAAYAALEGYAPAGYIRRKAAPDTIPVPEHRDPELERRLLCRLLPPPALSGLAHHVEARLADGEVLYGSAFVTAGARRLLVSARDEAADVSGWGLLLLESPALARHAAADELRGRTFEAMCHTAAAYGTLIAVTGSDSAC